MTIYLQYIMNFDKKSLGLDDRGHLNSFKQKPSMKSSILFIFWSSVVADKK